MRFGHTAASIARRAATLLGVLLLACHDLEAPPTPPVRYSTTPQTLSGTLPLGSESEPATVVSLGEIPETRAVLVKVTGMLKKVHLVDPSQTFEFGPSGYGWCDRASVKVSFGNGTHLLPGTCSTTAMESPELSRRMTVQGTVTASRSTGSGVMCGTTVCWKYEGSQEVSVEVLDFTIRIDATPTTLTQPTNVWTKWVPNEPAPSATPMRTIRWVFYPANGGQPYVYPYANNDTWKWIPSTGRLTVEVEINGAVKTAEKYFHVGPATLDLSSSPTEVYAGDSVHFDARVSPESTAVAGLRWYWFPEEPVIGLRAGDDAGSGIDGARISALLEASDSSEVVHCAGYRACSLIAYANGAMRVHATVGGTAKQADAPVSVLQDSVFLTATPSAGMEGREITFKARSRSGRRVRVSSWTWQQATGSSAATLTAACQQGDDECKTEVYESGTMSIVATIDKNAGQYAASAPVSVTPCAPLTGDDADPLLSQASVRRDFYQRLRDSHAWDPPEMYTRVERGGRVASNGQGEYMLVDVPGNAGSTDYEPPTNWPPPPPGWTWTNWVWHTHPHNAGDRTYGGYGPNREKCEDRRGDGNAICWSAPGASPHDLRWPRYPDTGFAVYHLDKEGRFVRHDYPARRDTGEDNREIRRWKKQNDSMCYQPAPCTTYGCRDK